MNFIPLMSPNITEHDVNAVVEVLRSGMLVQGAQVAAFEREVAKYLNVKNAVAVSNGTASLHLALITLGVEASDEVIVPAFSYIATANVVEIVGAKCVFVDIEPGTFNIDVAQIERLITYRTKAIIPVHEFGLACDISQIVKLAQKHRLFVIEDAACALGARENEKRVGTFGNIGSFSLHPRKAVTSGEGGLLSTDDDELAAKFRVLRNHGIEMGDGGRMDFVAAGFNYRMTDFQAALVRGQFKKLDKIIEDRNNLAEIYFEHLQNLAAIAVPTLPENKNHLWQTFHTVLSDEIDRDAFIGKLKEKGIGTNYGAQCIPAQTFYQNKYELNCQKLFPNAMRAWRQGLALPLYEKLKPKQIRFVAETVKKLLAERL